MKIYLIGRMASITVPQVAKALRAEGHECFDDWISSGEHADICWTAYEKARGRSYREALAGYHAQHAFALDLYHLKRCDCVILVAPAGKSAHLELGYTIGQGKPGYILMDGEPEKYDLMYLLATKIFLSVDELAEALR